MDYQTDHESGDGRGHSARLWAKCPFSTLRTRPAAGFYYHEDFLNTPSLSADADTGLLATYIDTGCTITQLATEEMGVARIALDGTANDESWMTTGGNTAGMAAITSNGGHRWFEARIRPSAIADGAAFFIGLASAGLAGADTMVDTTSALKAAGSFVGFRTLTGEGEGLKAIYQKGGETLVTVAAAATLTAAAWVKVGMYFNGKMLRYYIDGLQVASVVINSSTVNFPDGTILGPLYGGKNVAAAAKNYDIDWWTYAGIHNLAV